MTPSISAGVRRSWKYGMLVPGKAVANRATKIAVGRRRSGRRALPLEAPGAEVARRAPVQRERSGREPAAVTGLAVAAGAPVLVGGTVGRGRCGTGEGEGDGSGQHRS
jgi:hypothetical protein